jgi:hypothetical protein
LSRLEYPEDPLEGMDVPARVTVVVMGIVTPYRLQGEHRSQYQNAMEFAGVVTVLAVYISLGFRDCSFILQGDSVTALTWAKFEKFRGGHSQVASLIFVHLSMISGIVISDTVHLAGKLMDQLSDPLSRGRTPAELGYPKAVSRSVNANPTLRKFVALMDPSHEINLADDLTSLWVEIERLAEVLLSPSGGWE